MSHIVESLNLIPDADRLFEATLWDSGEVTVNAEDGKSTVEIRYDLDEVRKIHAALGHLIWIADNA